MGLADRPLMGLAGGPSGFSWPKEEGTRIEGMKNEMRDKFFQLVPRWRNTAGLTFAFRLGLCAMVELIVEIVRTNTIAPAKVIFNQSFFITFYFFNFFFIH